MNKIKIEDFELEDLSKHRLYINKYGTDIMPLYILNTYWKEFFFDLLSQLADKHIYFNIVEKKDKTSLFDYLKKEYYNIIINYELNIDINDYIEINDYIPFEDWLSIEGNGILLLGTNTYLIQDV